MLVEFNDVNLIENLKLTFTMYIPLIDKIEAEQGIEIYEKTAVVIFAKTGVQIGGAQPANNIAEIERQTNQASNMGQLQESMNGLAAPITSYSSYATAALDVDSSGHLLKLNQMTKFYSRFKVMDFNQGHVFGTYLSKYGRKYDPPSDKSSM